MCAERAGDGQEEDLKAETSRLNIPVIIPLSWISCNLRTVRKQQGLCKVSKGRRGPASSLNRQRGTVANKDFLGTLKWRTYSENPSRQYLMGNSKNVRCKSEFKWRTLVGYRCSPASDSSISFQGIVVCMKLRLIDRGLSRGVCSFVHIHKAAIWYRGKRSFQKFTGWCSKVSSKRK